jgi:hypothetical protein
MLLVLFGSAIAFPGYGARGKTAGAKTAAVKSADRQLWTKVLFRCLASGINLVEEQRSTEEEDEEESSCEETCYLAEQLNRLTQHEVMQLHQNDLIISGLGNNRAVPCPPPDRS